MNDWIDDLAGKEAAMTEGRWRTGPINYADIYAPGTDSPFLLVVKDRNTAEDVAGIVALRNEAARLIEIAKAARELVDNPSLAAHNALRKALEGVK